MSACRQEPLQTLTLFAVAGELHSYSEVCEALSTLEVALGFLAMTGGEPQMQLSRYLEEVLQMENQMAPHILKVSLSETPVTLSRLLVLHFLCMPTIRVLEGSSFVIRLVLSWVSDLKNKVLIGVGLFFMCRELDVLPVYCPQTLSMCCLKHCVALWQLLASLKSENILRLKRVRHQPLLPVHIYHSK